MSDSRSVFDEIMRRMKSRNLFAENDFHGLVDEAVADFIAGGHLRQEDDDESFREKIEMFWQERKHRGREE